LAQNHVSIQAVTKATAKISSHSDFDGSSVGLPRAYIVCLSRFQRF